MQEVFYYEPGGIATIKHRCVALLYCCNSIEHCAAALTIYQLSKPKKKISSFLSHLLTITYYSLFIINY